MARVERPTERVTLTLADGKERVLRYPLSALKQAREEFGASLLTNGGEALKNLDEDKLPKLIWYGLKADDPEITPDQLADLIDTRDLPYVMQQFILAYQGSLPEEPKNGESPQQAEAGKVTEISTGSTSGPSGDTTSA